MQAKVGSFVSNTATGNQAIINVGFQGSVVIFIASRLTADGTLATTMLGIGAATSSSDDTGVCMSGDHNRATQGVFRRQAAKCIVVAGTTLAIDGEADFVSMDSDGFTINWTDAPATAKIITYIVLGGLDNVKIGSFATPTSTGNASETGIGFQPDGGIFFGAGFPSSSSTSGASSNATGGICLGMATDASEQGVSAIGAEAVSDPMNVYKYQRTNKCFADLGSTGSVVREAGLTSFDADGFTLDWTTVNATAGRAFYVLWKGGAWKVGSDTQKTSTGTRSQSGFGFPPEVLLMASVNAAASSSVNNTANAYLSVGERDGSSEASVWNGWMDNTASAGEATTLSRTKALQMRSITAQATPTTQTDAEADGTLDSDGFSLDWTTADGTAREFIYLAGGDVMLLTDSGTASASATPSAASQAVKDTATSSGAATPAAAKEAPTDTATSSAAASNGGSAATADAGAPATAASQTATESLADTGTSAAAAHITGAAGTDAIDDGTCETAVIAEGADGIADLGESSASASISGADLLAEAAISASAASQNGDEAISDSGSCTATADPTGTGEAMVVTACEALATHTGVEKVAEAGTLTAVGTPGASAQRIKASGTSTAVVAPSAAMHGIKRVQTVIAVCTPGATLKGKGDRGTVTAHATHTGTSRVKDAGTVAAQATHTGAQALKDAGTSLAFAIQSLLGAPVQDGTHEAVAVFSYAETVGDVGTCTADALLTGADAVGDQGTNVATTTPSPLPLDIDGGVAVQGDSPESSAVGSTELYAPVTVASESAVPVMVSSGSANLSTSWDE